MMVPLMVRPSIVKELQGMTYRNRLCIWKNAPAKMGLGTAYLHGFKWALQRHYEFVFEMDADFSHDPE